MKEHEGERRHADRHPTKDSGIAGSDERTAYELVSGEPNHCTDDDRARRGEADRLTINGSHPGTLVELDARRDEPHESAVQAGACNDARQHQDRDAEVVGARGLRPEETTDQDGEHELTRRAHQLQAECSGDRSELQPAEIRRPAHESPGDRMCRHASAQGGRNLQKRAPDVQSRRQFFLTPRRC